MTFLGGKVVRIMIQWFVNFSPPLYGAKDCSETNKSVLILLLPSEKLKIPVK